jgi:hypothetical protein
VRSLKKTVGYFTSKGSDCAIAKVCFSEFRIEGGTERDGKKDGSYDYL